MKQTLLAKRYLDALKNSLLKEDVIAHLDVLKNVIQAITSHHELWQILKSPMIQNEKKETLIMPILEKAQVGEAIQNFFKILIQKNRISLLEDLNEAISTEIAELNNEIIAEISAPESLTPENEAILLTYLKDITSKKVKPEFIKTEDSLGGFKARIGNRILDGTLENSLSLLKQKFISLN